MDNIEKYIDYTDEIKEALEKGTPVVALESTIISHGMPYPQNVEMAKECQRIIRSEGCVPATIAIMNGRIKVGLSDEELEIMAKTQGVLKVSRRDFAYTVSSKKLGATTVATTMMGAAMAGIRFFATGGIGGVHRGFNEVMDVSADLDELAKTNVNVVCAGAKSILDLPRTLEYLETKGVPVIGYQTDTLPQFFTRESEYKLNLRLDTVDEIVDLIIAKDDLGLDGGVLITNPIPEEYSLDKAYIDAKIDEAVKKAEEQGIKGKDVTPFLLKTIVEETGGKSLAANIQLVYNNARLAAKLAAAYAKKVNA
ncbi:MAG: pseudouridine-5'-phosphate glycosidase [Erysipelotrichaceae bacterium]|nr:pseudouridine-5'-phosphate glycosidase [Erysipelotrichaceae bacterium]MBR3226910.1 pseudouridine-5'-phosphate glycosidase [Erysipelotrichaceae bacterium]